MKKLYLAILPSLLVAACSNTDKPLTKEALIGEWVCTTEYTDVGVGTVDIVSLNRNGKLTDDNYIFDHILNALIDKPVEDYFRSPLRYLRGSNGSWNLLGNTLTYDLKTQEAKRLIFPDVWAGIQKVDKFKKIEAEQFKLYSSNKEDKISLEFKKFIKNGFILTQNINGKSYESKCLSKDKSKHSYLEAYKRHTQIK